MIKTVHRWFWAWNYEKEENWLNEMSETGYSLVGVGFCKYLFAPCLPNEYSYRLEYLTDSPASEKGREYIEFLKETDVEYVGSMSSWAYFRKKGAADTFQIFSDIDSKITYLNKLLRLFVFLCFSNIFVAFINFFFYLQHSMTVSLIGFSVTILAGLLILYAYLRIRKTVGLLQKERILRE